MEVNSGFMNRCLQLAIKGCGATKPNPMVGAVIVNNNKIIGEGYHKIYGAAHAEVNAINSVKDEALLADSTMYVSLEPCAHFGKTPPCTELIISKKIPRVVIAARDPNPKVSGKGIDMLLNSGVKVVTGIMEKDAVELNRSFFVNQREQRPFIVLKWAQSRDGFIDMNRRAGDNKRPVRLSNGLTHSIVHKHRTMVQSILVGTNTAILDNPKLTARDWFGSSPTRIVIDRNNRIEDSSHLLDGTVKTIVFTSKAPTSTNKNKNIEYAEIDFDCDTNEQIIEHLYQFGIYSVMVEGGAKLLTSFIDRNLWDDAFIECSEMDLLDGVNGPKIEGEIISTKRLLNSYQYHVRRKTSPKFN